MFNKWYHLHIIVDSTCTWDTVSATMILHVLYILYMSVGSTVSIYCVVVSSTDYTIVCDSGHSSVTNNKLCTCTCRRPFYYWPYTCTCTLYIYYVHVHVDCFFVHMHVHVHVQYMHKHRNLLICYCWIYTMQKYIFYFAQCITIMHDNCTNIQMIDVYGTLLLCVWYCYRNNLISRASLWCFIKVCSFVLLP